MRCQTGAQNQLNQGSPTVEYSTVRGIIPPPLPGGVNYDIPASFRKGWLIIGVAAINAGNGQSNIYLHFSPTFLSNFTGAALIAPVGCEQWLPFQNNINAPNASVEGRYIRFKKHVQSFFFSMDHPNGATPAQGMTVTFFGTDSIEQAQLERLG